MYTGTVRIRRDLRCVIGEHYVRRLQNITRGNIEVLTMQCKTSVKVGIYLNPFIKAVATTQSQRAIL